MEQYHHLLHRILKEGTDRPDRTGTGTLSVFGHQSRYDLNQGFPLVTTKKIHVKSMVHELLWFLKGDTNTKYLTDNGVTIWNEWATPTGDLGPVYGEQWRSWYNHQDHKSIDQINQVIHSIKTNPTSRRHIVSAWNVADLPFMALPPCHLLFQFYVDTNDNRLSCQLYQRSADTFLGTPLNIASYALLTMMIAQVTNLQLGDFVHTIGDAHLYKNHIDQATEQLTRTPYPLPQMHLNQDITKIDDFTYDDIMLTDYQAHPHIKAEVAV